jgi:hypothetical protein
VTERLDLILSALRDDAGKRVLNAEIVEDEVLVNFDGTDYAVQIEAI